MSIHVDKIKDKSKQEPRQRALGLDGIRFNLQTALERLERVYQIESKLAQIENRVAGAARTTIDVDRALMISFRISRRS